mmetsp:Transcript_11234/g.31281  ORF Transcript_11234/g.31281 Transcript_11234/m.31281 type:complete len:277 (+) Transcript_11234:340-1170(+)
MAAPKMGSCMRISTDFCLSRRRFASSPLSMTVWQPPASAARSGSCSSMGSDPPCTVAMTRMPRCAMVRSASTSDRLEISSTMTTLGLWFSTASRIRSCCRLKTCPSLRYDSTGSQRALPMAGCGTMPSPPISHVLSTTTTMFRLSSARRRANSRSAVVLPVLGRPIRSRDSSEWIRSGASASSMPSTVRPTRAVTPMTDGIPSAFVRCESMMLRRCRVPSMPMRRVAMSDPVLVLENISEKSEISDCSQFTWANGSREMRPVESANTASGQRPSWR